MKSIIKLFFSAIVLLSSINASYAQIEDHYHSFSGNINIPIIVDHIEVMERNDGTKKENNIPDKKITISIYMKAEDMRVSKGVFSGIIIKNNLVEDEVITYKGKVSQDKQMLEYIEITKNYTIYLLDTRKDIEKKTSLSARFENIPFNSWGGFKYKYGVSKITSVSFTEHYSVPRYGFVESYSEKFIKVNNEQITKYSSCINVNFKPGNEKINNEITKKVAVILHQNKNIEQKYMRSVGAFIINGFMKIPGLKVLERMKIQKITDEIELSQSGLVNQETKVGADKMMIPDIEVIVTQENRVPDDSNLPFESYTVRSKIRIVATGQIIDANLIHDVNIENKSTFIWDKYVDKVVAFTKNFLYE